MLSARARSYCDTDYVFHTSRCISRDLQRCFRWIDIGVRIGVHIGLILRVYVIFERDSKGWSRM